MIVGSMASVVFDYDSTLLACESLELLVRRRLGGDLRREAELHRLTSLGMEGKISFRESLERRLALAAPARQEVLHFGREEAPHLLTEGMAELCAELSVRGVEIWVVSGAIREAMLPACAILEIPPAQVWGIEPRWAADGSFAGLDPADGFAVSKVEGVRRQGITFSRPATGVGDGMSDYDLCAAGLVDSFIAFTKHVRRASVLAQPDVRQAPDVDALRALLRELP